jgi:hypothetical protein
MDAEIMTPQAAHPLASPIAARWAKAEVFAALNVHYDLGTAKLASAELILDGSEAGRIALEVPEEC